MKRINKLRILITFLFISAMFFLYLTSITIHFQITNLEPSLHYQMIGDNVYFYKDVQEMETIKTIRTGNIALLLASYTSFIFIFLELIKCAKVFKKEKWKLAHWKN